MSKSDSSPSRPSKTNCHGPAKGTEPPETRIGPGDIDGGLRPLSTQAGTSLREEVLHVEDEFGDRMPLTAPNVDETDGEVKSRAWYRAVQEHTQWYRQYQNSHIEFEDPDGEVVRSRLENSYMPSYGDRYYAKLMDLKRGVERRWNDFSIIMLTLSASTLDAQGQPRPPADHMRDIAEGWDTCRKQLHKCMDGRRWTYARVWEPTTESGHGPSGYGHQHVAIFVEDGEDLDAEDFAPVMRSYVANTPPAGWEAHRPDGDAVSVTHELKEANAATYISEYIGQYGEELVDRPNHERAFLAVAWATNTRRVEFSSEAQDIISGEQFRRETGLRPEDRGESERDSKAVESDVDAEDDGPDAEEDAWTFEAICNVSGGRPNRYDPGDGGVQTGTVDGGPDSRPRDVGPPPGGTDE